ncbi:MAG: hypothetical protein H0X37_13135 [Herpetosiphonaceae bacterium]|nr:hypothetical protein [Herpetosiphonaceae bacterium]
MEQRTYHGNVPPEGLADYLVQHYDPQADLQAQKIGQGDSLMVQIGRGDTPDELRNALTLGITRSPNDATALLVTMGQQQWIDPKMMGYVAMMGLISIMVTPWALFALIWPLSRMLSSTTLPNDIWNTIELYTASQGAATGATQKLVHPHFDQDAGQL